MNFSSGKLEFDPNNPFQNDPLYRGVHAENLTSLLSNTRSMVMSISAPWGQGKTTFISMWEAHLHNHKFATLYFNAWESDYADDPLMSLIGTLRKAKAANESSQETIARKAVAVGKKFVKASPKIALNYLLRGGLNYITDGDESAADEVAALSEMAASFAEQQIRQQQTIEQAIADFKVELNSFAGDVSSEGLPFVIFIDELDRCRPRYAVELLEQIKHLFLVDGVVFVLAVDRERLGHAAASQLGFPPSDADGYLRRLIDIDFSLPQPDRSDFLPFWCGQLGLGDNCCEGLQSRLPELAELAKGLGLSLRVQYQCLVRFKILLDSFPKSAWQFKNMFLVMLFILAYDYDVVRRNWCLGSDCKVLLEMIRNAVRPDEAKCFTLADELLAWWHVEMKDVIGESNLEDYQRYWQRISHGSLPGRRKALWEMLEFSTRFRS